MTNAIRAQGSYLQRGATSPAVAQTITAIVSAGQLATVTTQAAHGLAAGSTVTVSGCVPAAYNGTYTVTSVPSATTFTYNTQVAAGGSATTIGAYTATNIAYAVFEEATSIKMGEVTVSAIDATHLLSTAKEFIAGLQDNGTASVTANFTNGVVQGLVRGDQNTGTVSPYQIVIPNGAKNIYISFLALVTKFGGPDPAVDKKLEITVSLRISGAVTIISQ